MDLDARVVATLIPAAASLGGALIGALVTVFVTRRTIQSKLNEVTQAQFKEVLAKRIQVYPQLWRIPQTLLSDWERERKPIDAAWARRLFASLIEWHAENGVFLSQPAYKTFAALRHEALQVVRRCDEGKAPTLKDLQAMDVIYYLGDPSKPTKDPLRYGLATWLKNDLGSYKSPALAVTNG